MQILRISYTILICFLFLAGTPTILSNDDQRIRVKVSVSSEHDKGEIESYIKRELRSLSDVIPVNNQPYWTIHIAHVRNAIEKEVVGHSLAFTICMSANLQPYLKQEAIETLKIDFTNLDIYMEVAVYTGHEDLKKKCQKLVAYFDTEYLEATRDILTHR